MSSKMKRQSNRKRTLIEEEQNITQKIEINIKKRRYFRCRINIHKKKRRFSILINKKTTEQFDNDQLEIKNDRSAAQLKDDRIESETSASAISIVEQTEQYIGGVDSENSDLTTRLQRQRAIVRLPLSRTTYAHIYRVAPEPSLPQESCETNLEEGSENDDQPESTDLISSVESGNSEISQIELEKSLVFKVISTFYGHKGTELDKFVIFAARIKELLFFEASGSRILQITLAKLGLQNKTDFTLVDLIIFSRLHKVNLVFENIFRFFNHIFFHLSEIDHNTLYLSYSENDSILRMSNGDRYTGPDLLNDTNMVTERNQLVQILINLYNMNFICIAFQIDSVVQLDSEQITVYNSRTNRAAGNVDTDEAMLSETIEPNLYTGILSKTFDIDGFWFFSQTKNLHAISGRFQLEFKDRFLRAPNMNRKAFVNHRGRLTLLDKIVCFRLGHIRFGLDSQVAYVFLVTNRLLNGSVNEANNLSRMAERLFTDIAVTVEELDRLDSNLAYGLSGMHRLHENSGFGGNYQQFAVGSRKIEKIYPSNKVELFMQILSEKTYTKNLVKGLYFESFGGKETYYFDQLEMWGKFERYIDFRLLAFSRIDIAVVQALPPKENLNSNGRALYCNDEFITRIGGKGTANFLSRGFSNRNKYLESCTPDSLLKIHSSGLTKINSYSTFIPLYFNRRFLVSKACQFTSVVLFNEMKRLSTHDSNRFTLKDRQITKSIRSAIREMEENRKSDHSFRLEISTGIEASLTNGHRISLSLIKSTKYCYDSTKLKDYLIYGCRKLLASLEEPHFTKNSIIKTLILDIFIKECTVSGSLNTNMISNHEVNEIIKTSIQTVKIPIFNIDRFLERIENAINQNEYHKIMSDVVHYSRSVSSRVSLELKTFITIVFHHNIWWIGQVLHEEMNQEMGVLMSKELMGGEEEILLDDLLSEIFSESGERFFDMNSSISRILRYWRRYRSSETDDLKIVVAALMRSSGAIYFFIPVRSNKVKCLKLVENLQVSRDMVTNMGEDENEELLSFIRNRSTAISERMKWLEADECRLITGLLLYGTGRNVVDKILENPLFCFFGSVERVKLSRKISYLRTMFNENTKSELKNKYGEFKYKEIGFSTICEIYKNRYGVVFDRTKMELLQIKISSFIKPTEDFDLFSVSLNDTSQIQFRRFYINSAIGQINTNENVETIIDCSNEEFETIFDLPTDNFETTLNNSTEKTETFIDHSNENVEKMPNGHYVRPEQIQSEAIGQTEKENSDEDVGLGTENKIIQEFDQLKLETLSEEEKLRRTIEDLIKKWYKKKEKFSSNEMRKRLSPEMKKKISSTELNNIIQELVNSKKLMSNREKTTKTKNIEIEKFHYD